jgi:LuxR family transcriptional regulator, maltose regulon positive regulatory protein
VTSNVPAPLLLTKLYAPPSRSGIIARPRLMDRLNEGMHRQLTLVSAPAGFGKTTLVGEWTAGCGRPVAWLSLDQRDDDPSSFLTYLVAALRTIAPEIGGEALVALQSPQPPPIESILTSIVNELGTAPDDCVLVLDDYHVLDSRPDDEALAFLLEHLPPRLHLVIATREDPRLPFARLRARGQLTELRAADLRFTPAEAAEFLERAAGVDLSADDIEALETRIEGWIAGLQMAAISLRGLPDAAGFIRSFTGSHRFVLDYLLEEVLQRQPAEVQAFLLRTSVLDRLCGPLCDAVLRTPAGAGDETLQAIERANLFIVPLDNERRWYRYHHLFGDLLQRRLGQSLSTEEIADLHLRASEWYEHDGQLLEAFQHATAADDVERAERLIDSADMDLHLRSVLMPILDWLASLPRTVLEARPRLLVRSATLALMAVQTTGVEEKLQAAERVLQGVEPDEETRDLIGQIACARATLAFTRYDFETMAAQARRAREYLPPENLPFRFTAAWAATYACLFGGDRVAAARACAECVELAERSGNVFSMMLAAEALGKVQELDNQLHQAAECCQRVLELAGEHPLPNVEAAHLSLASIFYQWNDLDAAERHAQQSRRLARLYDRAIDRSITSDVFLARVALARGDVDGAAAMLAAAQRTAHDNAFTLRLPDIAAAQVLTLIRQGQVADAARLDKQYDLPLSRARVLIAQGDPAAALAVLEPMGRLMEARGWADERLRTLVLQAVARHALGEEDGTDEGRADEGAAGERAAARSLDAALALAEPGGFVRLFLDEGAPMADLLSAAVAQGTRPDYAGRLLAAFQQGAKGVAPAFSPGSPAPGPSSSTGPLSQRELEVLRLVAQGLSNQEIGKRLYLALDTVKGHNRRIFEKLGVQRRTEAVARARELGLL